MTIRPSCIGCHGEPEINLKHKRRDDSQTARDSDVDFDNPGMAQKQMRDRRLPKSRKVGVFLETQTSVQPPSAFPAR